MVLQNLMYVIYSKDADLPGSLVDTPDVLASLPSGYPRDIVHQTRQALESEPHNYPRTTALAVSGYTTLTLISCFMDERMAREKR